ncbi:MAG: hypothetical protein KatS3mg060_1602 [Dehalococcoidia bacterium]|nr:MAG: hypothetical protein KatS3mg060_1602 [Dehalococcoidia bacterium]
MPKPSTIGRFGRPAPAVNIRGWHVGHPVGLAAGATCRSAALTQGHRAGPRVAARIPAGAGMRHRVEPSAGCRWRIPPSRRVSSASLARSGCSNLGQERSPSLGSWSPQSFKRPSPTAGRSASSASGTRRRDLVWTKSATLGGGWAVACSRLCITPTGTQTMSLPGTPAAAAVPTVKRITPQIRSRNELRGALRETQAIGCRRSLRLRRFAVLDDRRWLNWATGEGCEARRPAGEGRGRAR